MDLALCCHCCLLSQNNQRRSFMEKMRDVRRDASHDVTFGNRGSLARSRQGQTCSGNVKGKSLVADLSRANPSQGHPCISLGFAHPDMCKYICTNVHVYKYSSSTWPSQQTHIGFTLLPPIIFCFMVKEHHGYGWRWISV